MVTTRGLHFSGSAGRRRCSQVRGRVLGVYKCAATWCSLPFPSAKSMPLLHLPYREPKNTALWSRQLRNSTVPGLRFGLVFPSSDCVGSVVWPSIRLCGYYNAVYHENLMKIVLVNEIHCSPTFHLNASFREGVHIFGSS